MFHGSRSLRRRHKSKSAPAATCLDENKDTHDTFRFPAGPYPSLVRATRALTTSAMASIPTVGKILNEAQLSLSVHKKCVKLMVQRRTQDPETFLPELCNCILPVLLEYKVRAVVVSHLFFAGEKRGDRGVAGASSVVVAFTRNEVEKTTHSPRKKNEMFFFQGGTNYLYDS